MTRTIRFFAFLSLLGVFASAQALPTLYDVTHVAGTDGYRDTGRSAAGLTDVDGSHDDATAFLLFELGSYAPTISFGLYDYTPTETGVLIGDTLEVFTGSDAPADFSSATVHFNLLTGEAQLGDEIANIGRKFGFYINVGATGQTYYSHASLNVDEFDHLLMFDTSDNLVGRLLGSDVVLAWEDLYGGGDMNFSDFVVGISDVQPVAEPTTMALLGLGLLALGGARRRSARA